MRIPINNVFSSSSPRSSNPAAAPDAEPEASDVQRSTALLTQKTDELYLSKNASEDPAQEAQAADQSDLFLKGDDDPNQIPADKEGKFGTVVHGLHPLAEAIKNDQPQVVKQLLAHPKIKVNALGTGGSSPLDMALSKGNLDAFCSIYERLTPEEHLEKTFMPRLRKGWGEDEGKMSYVFPGCYSVKKDEFEAKDNKERRAAFGTPILVEALKMNPAIFHWLLKQPEAGELVNQKDAFGRTALSAAIQTGQPKSTIEQLLQLGADPVSKDMAGYYPPTWSADGGQLEILDLLLAQPKVKAWFKDNVKSDEKREKQIQYMKDRAQKMHQILESISKITSHYPDFTGRDQKKSERQRVKDFELVNQAVDIYRGDSEPETIIPHLALGADIDADDRSDKPGVYKGGHGRAIDYAERNHPKFELILKAAGVVDTNDKKDKAYYDGLVEKRRTLR